MTNEKEIIGFIASAPPESLKAIMRITHDRLTELASEPKYNEKRDLYNGAGSYYMAACLADDMLSHIGAAIERDAEYDASAFNFERDCGAAP